MVGRVTVVVALGTTQTIAWASSYNMPAILGAPIASALHLPTSVFFGLFSGALLLSAVVGPAVGRLIDRHGGRTLLAASNLVIAAGLLILAAAPRSTKVPRESRRAIWSGASCLRIMAGQWPR
jgi:MFS family permease